MLKAIQTAIAQLASVDAIKSVLKGHVRANTSSSFLPKAAAYIQFPPSLALESSGIFLQETSFFSYLWSLAEQLARQEKAEASLQQLTFWLPHQATPDAFRGGTLTRCVCRIIVIATR